MISEKLSKGMNDQIKNELESYYLYLSMASYFHSKSLDGMAHWMRCQAHEEMVHAMKFFDHLVDRGAQVALQDLKQIKIDWESPMEAWKDAYAHEQKISSNINDLTAVARENRDFPSEPLLNWFLDEQIEEEANASKIVDQMEMAGNDRSAVFMIDRELGARPYPTGSPLDPAAVKAA